MEDNSLLPIAVHRERTPARLMLDLFATSFLCLTLIFG